MSDKIKCPTCGVEIDEHSAGRCLDAWVASVVMGWKEIGAAGLDNLGNVK